MDDPSPNWSELRREMVETQLRARGVHDERVLRIMSNLPRERFLPEIHRRSAYDDRPVPIGHEQTISQPFIVAYMTEQLQVPPESQVLEIGTGCGYQTAVLAHLAKMVYSIERIDALRLNAEAILSDLGIQNVRLFTGDGSEGLPNHAPFDRILVTAAAPNIPATLMNQLIDGGILVIPVGGEGEQTVSRVVRSGRRWIETPLLPCRFVKLIGAQAWHNECS